MTGNIEHVEFICPTKPSFIIICAITIHISNLNILLVKAWTLCFLDLNEDEIQTICQFLPKCLVFFILNFHFNASWGNLKKRVIFQYLYMSFHQLNTFLIWEQWTKYWGLTNSALTKLMPYVFFFNNGNEKMPDHVKFV